MIIWNAKNSQFTKKEARRFCRAFFFGAGNRTGFSRLAAARSAPLSGHTVAGFTTASSSPVFALIFLWSKIKTSVLTEALIWCGKQDWILAARRRSVSAVLKPHWGLIHYGFFKSVSRVYKKEARRFRRAFFCGAGNRT
ncbi:MAG: hypothetical protein ACLVMH_01575 [Christensenellales bacterium]